MPPHCREYTRAALCHTSPKRGRAGGFFRRQLVESRRRYAEDDSARILKMSFEITAGVPREESVACSTAEDEAIWERMVVEKAMMVEKGWMPDGGIPLSEDNWEVNPETGKTEWAPFMLASPLPPGALGPVRYGWWPGKYRDGKRVKPKDVEADIEHGVLAVDGYGMPIVVSQPSGSTPTNASAPSPPVQASFGPAPPLRRSFPSSP